MKRKLMITLVGLIALTAGACASPAPGTPTPGPTMVPGGPGAATPGNLTPQPTVVPGGPAVPTPVLPTRVPVKTPVSPSSGVADVTQVEIVLRESLPVQVSALVRGWLPDGCTKIGQITQSREGKTITVVVETTRPQDAMCTMALVPFQQAVALNVLGLPKGVYTVFVNGAHATFELAVDNVGSTMPLPVTPYPRIAWADAEALVLSGVVAGVMQTHALEVSLRLKDGRTLVTTEPRIDLIFEVVRRCGAPCANMSIATE